ncbi:hypothetical protein [Roseibium sp.]|uniref:hypothetical protein n=1 Tax=Roseibium sp. TaxID=1936156 RepID=UPI0035123788
MKRISFRTRAVFDHMPRALDVLNRMDFRLHAARVNMICSEVAEVEIEFEATGLLSASVFINRLRQMHGITELDERSLEGAVQNAGALAGHEMRAAALR